MKEEREDEYVKEVNSYESWDIIFKMHLKDDDGLHKDLITDVWYAKKDLYGVVEFIIDLLNPIILKEDESYTWKEFIVEEYF